MNVDYYQKLQSMSNQDIIKDGDRINARLDAVSREIGKLHITDHSSKKKHDKYLILWDEFGRLIALQDANIKAKKERGIDTFRAWRD